MSLQHIVRHAYPDNGRQSYCGVPRPAAPISTDHTAAKCHDCVALSVGAHWRLLQWLAGE